ncbi:MAG: AsmA family protein [Candidatus Omnitrophota bacterium]
MKKIFIVLSLFFIIAAIGLFVFILTFDANKYKDALTGKIEELIDKDVKIGNISINLLPSLAFRVNGFAIKDRGGPWDGAILKSGSIDASLKLLPLIKKDIQIESLKLRGLELVIDKGSLMSMPKAGTDRPDQINTGAAALGALKFLAEYISITDSSVRYIDRDPGHAIDIKIDVIGAIIKNVSLYGPANIEARLSVFGRGAENAHIIATLYPEIETKKPYIKNLELAIDLGNLNIIDALTAVGKSDIANQFTDKEIKGKLTIGTGRLNLDPEGIYNTDVFLSLSEGMINAFPITESLKAVDLKAELKAGDVIIQRLTGLFADGKFSAKGTIKDVFFSQKASVDMIIQDINVTKLLPDTAPGKPNFEGTLGINISSQLSGLTGQNIADRLMASGKIDLSEGVLKDINILTTALDKLDMLPGLVAKLKAKLPDRYKELLKGKDTKFKPLSLDFKIQEGRLIFQKLLIESDAFYLSGAGYLGLNRDISVHSNIFIPKDLSDAFISVVKELAYLQDTQGMITMPIDIKGKFPNVYVNPDLDYVIQKLIVTKGQELLDRIFKKEGTLETGPQTEENSGAQPASEPEEKQQKIRPEEAIIKTIFDIISSPKN